MRERIIILGAGVMQGPAIKIAKELGFFTIAVDGSSSAPSIPMADQFEQIDLKDKEGIEDFARSLQKNGPLKGSLSGIMTAGTDFSATVAWVAERLGLPGIPYEAALNASDKARMRSCFKKAGLPSPEFVVIGSGEWGIRNKEQRTENRDQGSGIRNCCANADGAFDLYPDSSTPDPRPPIPDPRSPIPFPLVIKPVDNMGGRGCRRVNNKEEFREAAADALRFSRSGRAIAETFMEGPEFSVDAIVYHGEITICGLADRHIFFPPYFIEMGHTMPTDLPYEQQAAILETFCAGVRALGLAGPESVGAAKGDIKLTPSGPMIGEIAARLSGGYMSGWTYPYSSGVEPTRAAILIAAGRKPDGLAPVKNWTSAERAFISIPGAVKAITGPVYGAVNGAEKARRLPHIRDLFLRAAEGGRVSFPQNNVSKCGNVISVAPDRSAAIEAAENAARAVLIRLDPADDETEAFLADTAAFPPNAFTLTPELKEALAALPDPHRPDAFSVTGAFTGPLAVPPSSSTPYAPAMAHSPASPIPDPSPSFPISHSSFLIPHLVLLPFPAFAASGLTDYMGRSVAESLNAVRELTGLLLPETSMEILPETPIETSMEILPEKNAESSDNNSRFLGKSFWAALVRGGYQGAVYYIDRLRGNRGELINERYP